MTRKRYAAPPKGLSRSAAKWWRRVVAEYGICDAAGEMLLETALRCWDREEQARGQLDRDGCTTLDARGRPKAHPAAAVERDARSGFLAAIRALNLDVELLHAKPGRPPGGRA